MKLLHKIVVALLGLWLLFFLVYRGSFMWDQMTAQKKTAALLDAIQVQKYGEIADLYAGTKDGFQKMQGEQGFRLLAYDHVTAHYDDGCVCTGNASLTFEVGGKPLQVHSIVTLSPEGKPNQVCTIHPSGTERGSIAELVTWNRMFCGGGSF